MPIVLLPLTADQLIRKFNPQTLGILFSHIVNRLFMCYELPAQTTPEQKARLQVIQEKLRTYIFNLNRFDTDQNVAETPRIMILCITMLRREVIGPNTDTIVAQFDPTIEGLANMEPVELLAFLIILVRETLAGMKSGYPQTPRLITAINDYTERIDRLIREIGTIINIPPNNPIVDTFTNVVLRLKVGYDS